MICHYPDLSSASDRLKKISLAAQLIRSNPQIHSMLFQPRSQVLSHGISELVPQTSFRWEPSGGVAKCRQFFQSTLNPNCSSHIFFCGNKQFSLLKSLFQVGGGGWNPSPEFLICYSISKRFSLEWKVLRWGIFYGWWRCWRPVTSPGMVAILAAILDFTKN